MDMIDPLESGQDQKDGECDSPTASETAALEAVENCLVVEADLGMETEELERPVVQVKRSRRRNLILQQATVDSAAAIIDSDGFEYKATESASGGEGGGTVTYRVVQVAAPSGSVEEVESISHIINPSTANFTTGATGSGVQVLTSPINGQFYVIGSSQEVFSAGNPARSIAPRGQNDNVRSTTRRDERRRATHNEVERRRRDKINSWIMKLGKIIPDCGNEGGKQGQVSFEGQSKGGILAKACDYIQELRSSNQRMADNLKENERLALQAEVLRQQNEELRRDRIALHSQLAQNGISPCIDLASPVVPNDQEILS